MLSNFIPCSEFDMKMREKLINAIIEKYPFVKSGILAKSLCGRDIRYMRLGNNKSPVLFVAAFHGMEWLTSLVVLIFFEDICSAVESNTDICGVNISSFLKEQGLFIIPCLNPDGVEISLHGANAAGAYKNLVQSAVEYENTKHWQANARGVDLNHNFNANWDNLHKMEEEALILGPAPTRYGGPEPESEPETKALVNLCRNKTFKRALAFHSQGEEIYWDYGKNTPKDSRLMANVMSIVSGYKVSEPEGLAVGGGFKDWFISELKKPGFTIEIGKGQNPLPIDDISSIYKKIEKMLILSLIM